MSLQYKEGPSVLFGLVYFCSSASLVDCFVSEKVFIRSTDPVRSTGYLVWEQT